MGRRMLGAGMALLVSACAGDPAPRSSEAIERSARILAKLDQLEADLHQETTKLAVYDELDQRHRQTTQFACQVTDEQLRDVRRLAEVQDRKQQRKERNRRAIAVARVSRGPVMN
ncbi:MAG TPA: hypothetical protein VE620_13305 [Myxococcales bacterium]|jgi:hypothetical protein|nr:hypothetical protein [Myxococcales bacterium]